MRVYELAKGLGVTSREVIAAASGLGLGERIDHASDGLSAEDVAALRAALAADAAGAVGVVVDAAVAPLRPAAGGTRASEGGGTGVEGELLGSAVAGVAGSASGEVSAGPPHPGPLPQGGEGVILVERPATAAAVGVDAVEPVLAAADLLLTVTEAGLQYELFGKGSVRVGSLVVGNGERVPARVWADLPARVAGWFRPVAP